MKKLTIIILLLLSLFIMISCNKISGHTSNCVNDSTNINDSFNNSDIATDNNFKNEQITPDCEDSRPMAYFSNLEEYQLYFSNMEELPEGFVPYEAIKGIGNFKSLVIQCEYGSGLYNKGLYSLVDENGEIIYLRFQEFDETVSTPSNIILTTPTSNDLRILDGKQTGELTQGKLKYYYISGELLSVKWILGDIKFTLSGDSMLSDYQTGNVLTFTQKIINSQTSTTAISEFNKSITSNITKQSDPQ